jgi:protein-disulfide isomerase
MHDKLFSEERWGSYAIPVDEKNSLIHDYAREIGLDQAKFDAALAATGDNGISDKISRDKALAMKADVKGTPSFFVNGQAVTLDSDGQSFRDAIDQALEQTNQK